MGIDNYAICNPGVFPVREIPGTFLPGLIITPQTFGGWWVISRVLVIKNSASSGSGRGCGNSPRQWQTITCQQTGWFETLTFSSSPQTCAAQPPEVTSDFWHYKYNRMSRVFFYHVSMAQITSKSFFPHILVNSCSWNLQACRSHLSVTTWEGNISRRAVWFVIAIFVLLITLHILPVVLMSSFPQNVSFHPSPCAQSHRCSVAGWSRTLRGDFYGQKPQSRKGQYPTNAKEIHNTSGKLCRFSEAPFLQWGEKKNKKWTCITPFLMGQGWQINYQISNRCGIFTGNFSFSIVNSNQGNTLADIHNQLLQVGSQNLPRATVSSMEKCHYRLFVIKSSMSTSPEHDHSEKYEAALSNCGASISNTHFLSSLLT